ncbi:dol-P-Man:Man(7)GlcNAc(2)-PP-Dol alpha-1,6-mannosyltransferase isoform X2 [Physcomitrium patens]|uniref:Mannosyltransferase n=1 Tax=Physcomitrium patens TaxID=3218 RepID=A0A7I4BJP6_PHYPA|nr:dol-P-Man:Man(7)GlcNAc(2)-PP-Dol alpha-1,6-mannosyltransferase-like isoform X2 [Physcomitrium patens]|eukprot:XP_024402319.1 dol-P-Man:Man(7)GlcNAc(2)-PP-Dol alpha-1,6-mannosyltransferase-like isoform X2 [Physcomitrella patens]
MLFRKLASRFDKWDVLVAAIAVFHIYMAPYTKVEESFNTQAMHDFLFHRHHLEKYDHFEFPGVVPRTFLVRLVLGATVLGSLSALRAQVKREFGNEVSTTFAIITATQFHLLFYASRPLPNVFALVLVNLAFTSWMRGRPVNTLRFLVFTTLVFRCDAILLLAPVGLTLLWLGSVTFWGAFRSCAITAVLSIAVTCGLDSVVWRQWIWPEFQVLWFNSVLNRSTEWGVSPVHWYFTSALPRAMLAAMPLSLAGLFLERRVAQYVLPILSFIMMYSKLPHKELRFILFAVPMLNVAAASTVARIYNNRRKPMWTLAYGSCFLLLVLSVGASLIMSSASYANYPGGHALELLHNKDLTTSPKTVHIDVLPAMTGVSRFLERDFPWSYSKKEDLSEHDLKNGNFTYLLSAKSEVFGYNRLAAIPGFAGVRLQKSIVSPIHLILAPQVYIHGQQNCETVAPMRWPDCSDTSPV